MPSFRKWSEGFFSAFTHLSQKYAIIISNQYTGFVYAVVKSELDGSFYISSDLEDCVVDVFRKFYTGLEA